MEENAFQLRRQVRQAGGYSKVGGTLQEALDAILALDW